MDEELSSDFPINVTEVRFVEGNPRAVLQESRLDAGGYTPTRPGYGVVQKQVRRGARSVATSAR